MGCRKSNLVGGGGDENYLETISWENNNKVHGFRRMKEEDVLIRIYLFLFELRVLMVKQKILFRKLLTGPSLHCARPKRRNGDYLIIYSLLLHIHQTATIITIHRVFLL